MLSRRVQVTERRSKYQQTDRDRETQTDWVADVDLGGEGRIVLPSARSFDYDVRIESGVKKDLHFAYIISVWPL